MIKIAMITPGFLPVPAVNGGAVEVLATHIIEGNESANGVHFDVYTAVSYTHLPSPRDRG